MAGYYSEKLTAERLRACYDLAPARVRAYLESEIGFVLEQVPPAASVLELGCGYGRVLQALSARARLSVGIDTSVQSLHLAREFLAHGRMPSLLCMDATRLGFNDRVFDLTICIQNGICAFAVDQLVLMKEAVRVTKAGGRVLFSSYAAGFWDDRLAWFERQAAHGLIGEIDHDATGNGVIVCRDGFRATTMDGDGFRRLATALNVTPRIVEVDGSSLFCEMVVPQNSGGAPGLTPRV